MRKLFVYIVALLAICACASPGNPDGGPYDETPPMVVKCVPEYRQTNSNAQRIQIYFSELVQLDNATEKVVVSPPQINMPEIASMGRYIRVKLEDSLKANTTYTIDFSDAIVDNNEANPMGNYTYVFSTGDNIDTMEVAGTVLDAYNLEPVKGILVGLHSDTSDTAFTKKPLERVARTNGEGKFTIRGVKNGTYRVYALNDADGNFCYSQKSEKLAFRSQVITTGSYPDVRYDTIWADNVHVDSLVPVHFTHYTPDNIVLQAFTASHADRHLLKTERNVSEHFEIYFTAPSDSLPRIEGLNFDVKNAFSIEHNATNDTLCYWLNDSLLAFQDTLSTVVTYLENDSMGNLVERSDSIDFVSKISHEKQVKWAADAYKDWVKKQNKAKKKGLPYEETYPVKPLDVDFKQPNSMAPNENLCFDFKEPLKVIDTTKIHLFLHVDSLKEPAPFLFLPLSPSIMHYRLYGEWRPNQTYTLLVDSAAFIGIYGKASKKIEQRFTIASLDNYGTLFVNLSGVEDTTAVVQLLTQDKPTYTVRSHQNLAEFYFVKPAKYYMRLFMDRNGNGKWDEGDYDQGIPPEQTYYYPSPLDIKSKWDISQDWDVKEVPLNKQKPLEITKQKADKKRTIQNRNEERERNKRR